MSYYGNKWEMQISREKAIKYLNGKALPRMGCETDLIVKKDDYGFTFRLCILNLSGQFLIACSGVPYREWPAFFGFALDSQKAKK